MPSTKLTEWSHLEKFSSETSMDAGVELSDKTSTSRLGPAGGGEFKFSRSVRGWVGA